MKKRFSRIIGVGVTLALLTSLFVMAIPASALSQPQVSISTGYNDISDVIYPGKYTITFVTGKALSGANDYITITFPVGTTLGYPYAGNVTATVDASPVWVSGAWQYAVTTNSTWITGDPLGPTARQLKLDMGTNDQIGLGATVTITVQSVSGKSGLVNPPDPGDYTLTVKTSDETTAVTSAAYTIKVPSATELPGRIDVYNPSSIVMSSHTGANNIAAALAVSGENYTLKLAPGIYTEDVNTNFEGLTFVATGTAAETVIRGDWTIDEDKVTVDGLTLHGGLGAGPTVAITGDEATIQNCTIEKSGTAAVWYYTDGSNETLMSYTNTDVSPKGTISNCTIDSTIKSAYVTPFIDTCLDINSNGLTVSGCTFNLDGSTDGLQHDTAVDLGASTDWTFTYYTVFAANTITGSSGIGLSVTDGAIFASLSTLSDLYQALYVNGAGSYVSLETSTVSNCGKATTALDLVGMAGMVVDDTTKVMVKNSTVTNSPNDIIEVNADADKVFVMFNDVSGNAKGVDNDDTTNYVTATHNWWGDPLGPSTTFNAGKVYYVPVLGGTATGSFDTAKTELIKKTTVGVDVVVTSGTGTMDIVGVANYADNPQDATEDPALAGGFYDVLVSGVTGTVGEITLKFYNANVSEDTTVLVWSKLMGAWTACAPASATAAATQGINLFGGYAWVKVSSTSTPSIGDLAGTEFALVEPPPEPALDVTVAKPAFGAQDVSIKPTFTWTAAEDAIGYEFVLAEELGLDDPFEIIDYSATSTTNGHVAREDLKYSTTYWWRVRSSSATATGDWVVSFFTTEAEPEEALPPVIVEEKETPAPVITVEIPPAVEKVTSAIPDWALYTIIAVGAVLIIAVIVLIVRTRRVA